MEPGLARALPRHEGVDDGMRLVLVAGYGRSGSTILDRILGHHPEVVAVGELVNVHRELWVADHYCGCGKRGRDCPFWREVRGQWLSGRGDDTIDRYLELRGNAIGRVGMGRVGIRNAERMELVRENAALYRAIAAVSGRRVIVDSSKSAGWVNLALRIPGADTSVVHLVRDGRSVLVSLRKPLTMDVAKGVQHDIARRSALHSSLAWLAGNVAAERTAGRRGVPSLRLSYERLLAEPAPALAALGRLIEVDLGEEALMIESGLGFPRTHAVAGGRVRMSDSVVIERKVEPARLSLLEASTFWLTAGALAWRYGYRPTVRHRGG